MSRPECPSAYFPRLLAVVAGHDGGLHGVQGRHAGGAAGHDALEELTGVAVAVVAADAENDRPLLVHRDVPVLGGPDPIVLHGKGARRGVAAIEREPPLAAVL